MIVDKVRRTIAERRARWEAICRRCGQCCYEKETRGLTAVTNYRRPCVHLDTATRTCTVYEKRFTTCSQCRKMTLRHALFVRWLPENCGYVQRYRVWARSRFRASPGHAHQWRADPWARSHKNQNPPDTAAQNPRNTAARCG